MDLLSGKVIAITGATTGIGRETALQCAKHGARLVLHHIGDAQSEKDLETLRTAIRDISGTPDTSVAVAVDVRDHLAGKKIVDSAVSAWGEINVIVNNAGICRFIDFSDVSSEQVKLHMDVNYAGPFGITQAVVEQMKRQRKGGSVISIASISATQGSSQLIHYSATKAAVLGMTVSSAVALGKFGIRVNAVSPGTVETSMNKEDLKGPKRAEMEDRVPLGRLGVPEDIAGAVVFFASDLSRYISGQNLIVDGASSINYQ